MGAGADYAYGYEGNDYLYGEAGADVLYGGAGVDVMIGGADGDWFDGGEGVNYYFGGNGGGPGSALGPDVFVARDLPGVQVIQDWTAGQGVIRFEGSGLSSLAATLARGFQNGAYYVIQIDVDTAVWINGATAASLTAADFVFIS
jgi:Ca2+-binding RTX toxin-like protein